MIIKKFQGKTKEEALECAKKELGEGLVEMNVKTIKSKGLLGIFKTTKIEVTVAKEEDNEKYGMVGNSVAAKSVEKEENEVSLSQGKIIPMKQSSRNVDEFIEGKAVGQAVAEVLAAFPTQNDPVKQVKKEAPRPKEKTKEHVSEIAKGNGIEEKLQDLEGQTIEIIANVSFDEYGEENRLNPKRILSKYF